MSYLPYGASGLGSWSKASAASVLVHCGAVALVAGSFFASPVSPSDARTQHLITIDRLDPDVLAGMIAQQGAAQDIANGQAEEAEPSAAAIATEDEQNIIETPEDPGGIEEPEEADLVTPDLSIPEDMVVEQATAVLVEEPLRPATPDVLQALPPNLDSPLARAADESAGSAPPDAVAALRAETGEIEVLTARGAYRPSPSGPPPVAAPPSAQDLALGDLAARITLVDADPCLVALPRRDSDDGVGLEIMASTDTAMARFADDLLGADDTQLRQVRVLVDQLQCAALGFLRETAVYPVTRIGISLQADVVSSGSQLSGELRGGAGRFMTLLVIDNNGVVQDVQRFTSTTGPVTRFDIPMTRNAPLRDTRHLLLALATDTPAVTLRGRAGLIAADVFDGQNGDEVENMTFGLVAFEVR
ncbi:MAG: hypothetical protein II336_09015 [Loktanella sp.]|nr:hypothetical protein [Loktanella sp.]